MAHKSTRTHLETVLLAQRPAGESHDKTRAGSGPARPKPSPPGKVFVVPARRNRPPRWTWVVVAAGAMLIAVVAPYIAVTIGW